MSESDGEQAARSVALEQAYVHEVYEQCAEKTSQGRHWPRIYQFLEELEPGALVCDIGCGNGKYLNVNHSIFKVGVDRCKRFTNIAREKENEVLICDNLALPFRDESFDAVLSIAVVHHFATTERRVHALKELARVLRIGGRLVISVWAMEQRHRKFESQDVLVPWPKAYCDDGLSDRSCGPGVPNFSDSLRDRAAEKHLSASKRASQRRRKSRSYWIDPIFSPSPSTSSLSSPNETCYSFFRRALQKLAGGRRGSRGRPWFLDGWQYGGGKERGRYDEDDTADVDELPIELRRLEDAKVALNKQPDSFSVKSKSLGDILEIQRLDLVRSRSSIPRLCSTLATEPTLDERDSSARTPSTSGFKPRLVKQKSHLVVDDVGLENPTNTAIPETTKDLPDCQVAPAQRTKRGNVPKQYSMNEELMSTERLEEKERVRRNIMKQTSLNEEIICKRRTFEAFKDSIYSGRATKKFQLLKSGLTNKIRQSTTNIEKVSGMSIKNGFVKILQGWKSNDDEAPAANSSNGNCEHVAQRANDKQPVTVVMRDANSSSVERRLSKEDGSDSSKDSSLQSDTSVDSEDSFASVIYVPKQDIPSLINAISVASDYQLNATCTTSAPPSPRVKQPPDLQGPRLKLISISPLLKQFPPTSKSLPPPSPPVLSPRVFQSTNGKPFFGSGALPKQQSLGAEGSVDPGAPCDSQSAKIDELPEGAEPGSKRPSLQMVRGCRSMSETVDADEPPVAGDVETTPVSPAEELREKPADCKTGPEASGEEESRKARLNQIKELLKQKPGFATRTKPSFPLVRRASTVATGRLETVTRVLPRLLSLELFNPETDDLDSDSSGVSSPESVGSVISVISDERFILKKDGTQLSCEVNESDASERSADAASKPDNADSDEASRVQEPAESEEPEEVGNPPSSPQNGTLGEVEAGVAGSSEKIADAAMLTKSRQDARDDGSNEKRESKDYLLPVETTWNEECRQHLIEFTEKLSENLIHDIDRYREERRTTEESETGDANESWSSFASTRRPDEPCAIGEHAVGSLSPCDADVHECSEPSDSASSRKSNDGHSGKARGGKGENIDTGSDDIMDFVMVSKSGEFVNDEETSDKGKFTLEALYLKSGNSVESSDIGDSIENIVSLSDGSQAGSTGKLCSGSTVSLLSSNAEYTRSAAAERRRFHGQRRSASEEIPRKMPGVKRCAGCLITATASNDALSGSSSQESLPSDRGGGAITYHQYYHVFKEGELDQLINNYVENLHIISSYYDHASWCIVAEKVQVWTI